MQRVHIERTVQPGMNRAAHPRIGGPRRMRRVLAVVAAVAVAAGVVALPASPAGATKQRELTVRLGAPAIAEFPPIPANYPRPFVVDDGIMDPDDCSTAGTGAVCDTIPLKIVPPDLGPFDDWYVRITLSWQKQSNGVLELDLYLWDDRQNARQTDPNSNEYTRLARGQTALNPESLEVIRPSLGQYNVTVSNWNGRNTGYKLHVELLKGDPFESPFESTEPPPKDFSGDSGGAPIFDLSADDFFDLSPGAEQMFSGLSELTVLPDDGLGSLGNSGINELPQAALASSNPLAIDPPGPASGLLMFLWLVLLPLAGVGGVVAFLLRKSGRSEWSLA